MDDNKALYEAVLGLEAPWQVSEVKLNPSQELVEVHVVADQKTWPCPCCKAPSPRYDSRSRRWRHLDTCQFQTILLASVPRVKCGKHGVQQVPVPWADRGSKFTALFEAKVLDWLREASISAVANLFGLSWNAVDGIMKRAVRRGIKRRVFEQGSTLPVHLGIDETSFQKRHEYVSVLCDQENGHVVHVADGRTRSVVEEYLKLFPEAVRARVETVAMDMWQAYISAVEAMIPGAGKKICFDKFHMAQHLSRAVDQVRRAEHKRMIQSGESCLKQSRYLWLKRGSTLSRSSRVELSRLQKIARRTARAWAIKEAGMDVWRYRSRHWAREALRRWYSWAIRSRLAPVKKVARMVKRHLEGLVNAVHHGVTNARSEGINSRIQWVKYTARGFRNRDRFRRAIYFHLGGLDMTPESLQPIRSHTS